MSNYKVKQEDLIGDIEGFPICVVQKMVDCQVEQGNKEDVMIFQRNRISGFIWTDTKEGLSFWNDVIFQKNFEKFFERYPKEEKKSVASTPFINQLKATYVQEGDSSGGDETQFLEIWTEGAGGGKLFVISTDRWAFDSIDEMIQLLEDFKKKM